MLRWTSRAELDTTPAEVAERLLVPEAQLRDVLDYAEQTGMLHIDSRPSLRLASGSVQRYAHSDQTAIWLDE